ncbi:MAG: hypothetical protein H7210_08560 [Pyrinomonadaceae bacterium]|nr:hypothetical protein [Phycisphaerales bacterium]
MLSSLNKPSYRSWGVPHIVVAVGIALIWLWAGLSKLTEIIKPVAPVAHPARWADQFPEPLLVTVACVEVLLGFAICAGFRKRGLIAGIVLLSAFCAALVIWPPLPAQPCGCLGSFTLMSGLDSAAPETRNLFFASLHLFALALMPRSAPVEPKQTTSWR